MALQALVVRVPPFLVPAVQLHMVDLFLGLSTVGCQVPSFCSYWIRVQMMSKEEEWELMEVLEDQGGLSRACKDPWFTWSGPPATLGGAWELWALELEWA